MGWERYLRSEEEEVPGDAPLGVVACYYSEATRKANLDNEIRDLREKMLERESSIYLDLKTGSEARITDKLIEATQTVDPMLKAIRREIQMKEIASRLLDRRLKALEMAHASLLVGARGANQEKFVASRG